MLPILVTPPARYPVSLAEARLQLGLDTQDYDPRLAALIAASTEAVEIYMGRALISRTYKGFLTWWPCDRDTGAVQRYVSLDWPPLISVAHVITYDDADVPTTFSAASYFVSANRTPGRIVLRRDAVWPIPLRAAEGIEIQWTAGYGDNPADVPETVRLAILAQVGFLNEQRGDEPVTDGGQHPASLCGVAMALLGPPGSPG
jgi:uncharacterized phiE125 gp8 family phage protein